MARRHTAGSRDALESGKRPEETPVAGATADHLTYRMSAVHFRRGTRPRPSASRRGDVRPAAVPQVAASSPGPKSAAAEVLFGFWGSRVPP